MALNSERLDFRRLSIVGVRHDSETVVATRELSADESGLVIFLNAATEFVTTLPLPAPGLHFTFVVTAAPSGANYTVVTKNSANIIVGKANPSDGGVGDTGATDDTVSFVSAASVAGDKVEFFSNGVNWFAYAVCSVATGVTFTTAT